MFFKTTYYLRLQTSLNKSNSHRTSIKSDHGLLNVLWRGKHRITLTWRNTPLYHCNSQGTHPFDMERNRWAARGWKLLTDRGKRGPEEVSPGKWQAISVSPTCGPVGAINSPLRALPHRVGQPFPAGFKQTRCHQQLQGIHCSSYQCAIVWAASSSL